MNKRINTSLLALVMFVGAFTLSGTQSMPIASAAPASSFDLLGALPVSDFIVYVDTQRVVTDVIPALFAEQPEIRAKLDSEIEKFRKHVAFDLRSLDAIAIGLTFNSQGARGVNIAVIARGRFDANAAIESGLTRASKVSRGELMRRTQVYEGRTLYTLVPVGRSSTERGAEKETESKLSDHAMVFVALDSNTVAFGNLKNVLATIDAGMGRGGVDNELVQLATRTPNAVACFSGKVPPDMARLTRFGNKDAENSIASMKQVYGSFSLSGNNAELLTNVRMEADEDARKLSMALNALKFVAKLGAAQVSNESKSIEGMIKNVEIYAVGNEVQITTRVPLTDLAPFIPKR